MLVPTVYVENATIFRHRRGDIIRYIMFDNGDIELGICSTTDIARKFSIDYF